jgi:hypothetical protein
MDEKTQKEVETMLAEEREKLVKQQSLVSWLRAWFWLVLVEKKRAVAETAHRGYNMRPQKRTWRARLYAWLSRPFRAWAVYKYAKLDRGAKEKAEDAWLAKTVDILQGGPVYRRHGGRAVAMSKAVLLPSAAAQQAGWAAGKGRMPPGSAEVDYETANHPFVKFILGQ